MNVAEKAPGVAAAVALNQEPGGVCVFKENGRLQRRLFFSSERDLKCPFTAYMLHKKGREDG